MTFILYQPKINQWSSLWPLFQKVYIQDNALNTNYMVDGGVGSVQIFRNVHIPGRPVLQELFKTSQCIKENSTPRPYLSK